MRGIKDREVKELWRDYQHGGNALGLSFVEYIAARVNARQPRAITGTTDAEWYVASCGHFHPWGASCSEMAVTQ